MDAKRHIKLFCMISNCFWRFPLRFAFFPPLFKTQISMYYAAVCGTSCGQKRSPPFAGNGFPGLDRERFRASAACIVTLKVELGKSFLRRPRLRNWGL